LAAVTDWSDRLVRGQVKNDRSLAYVSGQWVNPPFHAAVELHLTYINWNPNSITPSLICKQPWASC